MNEKVTKYLRISLKTTIFVALLVTLYGAWATQRLETTNAQIFWDPNRLTNGLGVLFLLLGWVFWEVYAGPKSKKNIIVLSIALVSLLAGVILINGLMGSIAGFMALGIMSTWVALDKTDILAIGGKA